MVCILLGGFGQNVRRSAINVGAFIALTLVLILFAPTLGERPYDLERAQPWVSETLHPTEEQLLRLSGEGRFDEVMKLGRARISSRPQSCLPYLLTVMAAERTGELHLLTGELQKMVEEHPDDLNALVGSAYAFRELEDEEKALQRMTLAVRGGVQCARAYRSFVKLSQKHGRLGEAEVTLEELLKERPTDAGLLFARANLWDRRGQGSQALLGYQEALLKAPPLALTCFEYARLLMAMGKFEQALSVSRLGIQIAGDRSDPDTLVRLLTIVSDALERLERESESDQAFERALGIARDSRLGILEAEILLKKSVRMGSSGRSDLAVDYLAKGRAREGRLFSPEERAVFLKGLGDAHMGLGEQDEAEAAYEESVELAASENEPFLELSSQIHLAAIFLGRGERQRAQSIYSNVLKRAMELEDPRIQGRALSGLAATHERAGSYRIALQEYRRGLELVTIVGDRRAQAIAMGNVGLVYFRLGLDAQAFIYTTRATQIARDLKALRLEVAIKQGVAASLAGLGDLEQSKRVYQAALDVASRLPSPELHALVLAGWARVSLELGHVEDAETAFQQALALARSSENTLVSLQSLSGLGLSAWRQEKLGEAEKHFEEALGIVESFRRELQTEGERMSYLETRAQVYSSLAAVLVQRDRAQPGEVHRERAFEVVERSRSRALLDILTSSGAGGAVTQLPRQWLESGKPVTSRLLHSQVLKDGDVLLEFALGEPESYLWVISREEFRVVSLPSRTEIENLVRSFLETVASPPRAPGNPFERHLTLARDLFDALLGPVRQLILGSRHLIISPDGILYHLPFGALVGEREAPFFYLVENVPLSYVPSALVLAELDRRSPTAARPLEFLGVAQSYAQVAVRPETVSGQLNPQSIPFADEEVESVAHMFPVDRRRIFLGPEATELAVKEEDLGRFRVLHFATHAYADGVFPERSAIFLAADDSGEEDGILRMGEVLNLPLSADLVVLSGCQTGLGRLLRAEGTVGLPWAFLSAGSSSVLVSLWNVNDRSTSVLMQAFYQHLKQGESRARALSSATQVLLTAERKAFRHPYYWAPFVLVGLANESLPTN
jgi:CHAT domain-containing protein